jgi:hypothetical protein
MKAKPLRSVSRALFHQRKEKKGDFAESVGKKECVRY